MSKYTQKDRWPPLELEYMPDPIGEVYRDDVSVRKKVKCLIKLSQTLEEADNVINKYYHFKTIGEKVAFLKGMFGVERIGREKDEADEMTYFSMLSAIIND